MKALAAALHWERRKKKLAWLGWCARHAHWMRKADAFERAALHHHTRLLDAAFLSWIALWHGYQVSGAVCA